MPFKEMIGEKQIHICDVCRSEFQFGRTIYNGRYVSEIDRTLCLSCAPSAWQAGGERLEELKKRFQK